MSKSSRGRTRKGQPEQMHIALAGGGPSQQIPASVAQSVRYLASRVRRSGALPERLAFTSSLRGEGVTFTSRAYATVLAHDTKLRVVLVDLNWWSYSAGDVPSDNIGLSDVIRLEKSVDDALIATNYPNLWLISSGDAEIADRSMLARDGSLDAVLDELSENFDHVILDLPATRLTSDAIEFARLADEFVLVVRSGVTTIDQVEAAVADLSGVTLAGVVVNASTNHIPRVLRKLVGL